MDSKGFCYELFDRARKILHMYMSLPEPRDPGLERKFTNWLLSREGSIEVDLAFYLEFEKFVSGEPRGIKMDKEDIDEALRDFQGTALEIMN